MIPGNASAALIPYWPNSDAKALRLFLIHSFQPFSSSGGGGSPPPPDAMAALPPPDNNASTSTSMAIPIAMSKEAIVIPCSRSLNRVRIFSAKEVSLSNTLAIVSLKLVIWDFSLPLRVSTDSGLVAKSSFRASICLVMSSRMPSSYSPGYSRILSSFRCSFLMCSFN